jgi:hypothetical protein
MSSAKTWACLLLPLALASAYSHAGAANARVNNVGAGAEPTSQAETTIVEFDYDDPGPDQGVQDVILGAWNDFNPLTNCGGGFCFPRVGLGRSLDGAQFQHWTLPNNGLVQMPANLQARGDPVLAVDYHAGLDGLGNPLIHLAHMGRVQPGIPGTGNAILVSQSLDGGRSFLGASAVNISNPANALDDKPWIAVDQRGGARPPDGNVYVCWTRLAGNLNNFTLTSQILLSQGTPGGGFGAPIAITPARLQPRFVQGCQVAVDILGHVYVSWVEFLNPTTNTPTLMIRHAPPPTGAAAVVFDAAVPVEQLRRVASLPARGTVESCAAPNWLPGLVLGFLGADFGMNFPSMATNPVTGDVYLTWSMWNGPPNANGPNRFDVFFKSADRPAARTDWFRRRRVNNDGPGAVDQFMPAVATYPLPVFPVPLVGDVGVAVQWYDKRNSGALNNAYELWSGEGSFVSNTLISDGGVEPMNPTGAGIGCRIGDYNSLTSGVLNVGSPDGNGPGTYFLHIWGDTRGNSANDPEVFFQSQFFDPGSLIEIPPILVDIKFELFFTQLPVVELPVGERIEVPIEALISNGGPDAATAETYFALERPAGISAGWIGERGDACYGPAPEEMRGPFMPTVRVDCESAPQMDVLGMAHDLAGGAQEGMQRRLAVACEEEGTFELNLSGGTGPVLPEEMADDVLSNNGLDQIVTVDCLPDPRPPMPTNLEFTNKTNASWDPVQEADFYRLVRGIGETLPAVLTSAYDSCTIVETALTETGDVLTQPPPAPGVFFWYLITAIDAEGDQSPSGDGRIVDSLGDCQLCPQPVCYLGDALDPSCADPCIGQVCQQDPFCCDVVDGWWDTVCFNEVVTICGSLVCLESTGVCAHDVCETGVALTSGCDDPPISPSCVSAVCGQDQYCCDPVNGAWDGLCVSMIPSFCGLSCE